MKILMITLALLFVACSGKMENASISDYGKKEIGKGLYLKKIEVNSDRVYILVDENDRLINGSTASSYTVYSQDAKGNSSSHIESNSLINP